MPNLHDIYCGRLLIKHQIVSPQQIWEALRGNHAQYLSGVVVGLSTTLKRQGYLDQSQLAKLNKANQRHQSMIREKLLARLVFKRGLASRETLRSLVERQRREGYTRGLGPMLVEAGTITPRQLEELLGEQSVVYAETVAKGEDMFLQEISELRPPYSPDEERKVLELLGLTPGRRPKTDGLWSRQRADAEAGIDPEQSPAQSEQEKVHRSLLESSDAAFMSPISGRLSALADPLEAPPRTEAEGNRIYGYEILKEIGKGSMGVVYKARHIFSDRICALKVLPLRLASESSYLERFKREAIASMRLQHENVVRAYDFGGSESYYYLALEFVDGITLEERLSREGRIDQREALKIIRDVARGLEFAWRQNILHRDIKPENILLTRQGVGKLCDFGIVKLLDISDQPNVTMAGTTVGTPYYISPEQARGEESLDIRSDIYSLGITFFHIVTGEVPFTGKSQGAILVRHILEEVPSPALVYPPLDPAIVEVIKTMTRKKRADRYQDPGELVRAIDAILGR